MNKFVNANKIKLNNSLQKVKEVVKTVEHSRKEKLSVNLLQRRYLHFMIIMCLSVQSYSPQMISIRNLLVMVT